MLKKTLGCVLCLGIVVPLTAVAGDDKVENSLVQFEGAIGSQPLRAGGAPNLVQGISPGGAPWVIENLRADVKLDGKISVAGRGLLVGGGNRIGTNVGQSVRARLFCGNIAHDTGLVPLDASGDFQIRDTLVPVPVAPCDAPTLLIVNTGGSWFAAGIPKLKNDD